MHNESDSDETPADLQRPQITFFTGGLQRNSSLAKLTPTALKFVAGGRELAMKEMTKAASLNERTFNQRGETPV